MEIIYRREFTNISGSDVDAAANCDTSKGDVCPDVTVDTERERQQMVMERFEEYCKIRYQRGENGV